MQNRSGLLIFDLDGTLIDSVQDLTNALNFALSEQKIEPLGSQNVKLLIGDGIDDLLLRSVSSIKHADITKLKADFTSYYTEHLTDTTRLYPDITDILMNVTLDKAILTNKRIGPTETICLKLGITKYFKAIIGDAKGVKLKPDPEQIIKLTAGYDHEACFMIGDGVNDILAAHAAGIRSISAGYGYTNKERLMELKPDVFVEDTAALKTFLTGLKGAAHA
jgi:phosphoglycolate phosphatase